MPFNLLIPLQLIHNWLPTCAHFAGRNISSPTSL